MVVDATSYLELVGEVISFVFKTDDILDSLELPHVDWIVEDNLVFNLGIGISPDTHSGFELAENNDIILDKDNGEHRQLVMDALYDAYEVGTSREWFRKLKDLIETCYFCWSDIDGHQGIVKVDVGFDETRIVVNRDLVLISGDSIMLRDTEEGEGDDSEIKEQVEWIPYNWDDRAYWIRNHHVDWEWDEKAFIAYLKEEIENMEGDTDE